MTRFPGAFDAASARTQSEKAAGLPAIPDAATPGGDFRGSAAAPSTCIDTKSNPNGSIDCADPSCTTLRSCCVGDGDCCSSVASPPIPPRIAFEDCNDAAFSSCLPGLSASAFGMPGPWVTGNVFYPGGGLSFDAGVVVGGPISLTEHRIVLEVTFAQATDCDSTCFDGVGAVLTTQTSFDERTHVRPLVGLLLSGSRDQVSLVVEDQTLGTWDRTIVPGRTRETWKLAVRPTGEITVLRDGMPVPGGEAKLVPEENVRLALFGRSGKPAGSAGGAGIAELQTQVSLCDIPRSWLPTAPVVVQDQSGSVLPLVDVDGPSLAYDETGSAVLAFEEQGSILFASRSGDSRTFKLLSSASSSPVVQQSGKPMTSLHDPELVWDPDRKRWILYFITELDGMAIARAESTGPGLTFMFDGKALLAPSSFGVLGFDGPTVIRHSSSTWVMIARGLLRGGGSKWMIFTSTDGAAWSIFPSSNLDQALDPTRVDRVEGFQAEEVAEPSLAIHDGAYQLLYARRRGTRWSIGSVVSDELLFWRHIDEGRPILTGSGMGFDSLGVRAPDLYANGASQQIELVYLGLDGTHQTLGYTTRMATDSGSR